MLIDNDYYVIVARLRLADPKKRFEIIVRKLRESGHRITPQRLAIVHILARSDGHPSVETIHDRIKKDFPTMSLDTVYKNVEPIKILNHRLDFFGISAIVVKKKGNTFLPVIYRGYPTTCQFSTR